MLLLARANARDTRLYLSITDNLLFLCQHKGYRLYFYHKYFMVFLCIIFGQIYLDGGVCNT